MERKREEVGTWGEVGRGGKGRGSCDVQDGEDGNGFIVGEKKHGRSEGVRKRMGIQGRVLFHNIRQEGGEKREKLINIAFYASIRA